MYVYGGGAQNFGGVNFWRLVARHAISGENLANPAQLVHV